MESNRYQHKVVLVESGFQSPHRRLFFSRARLYFDRIELTGWHLRERYEEVIPLDAVEEMEWQEDAPDGTVALRLADGRTVVLQLSKAGPWRRSLEVRLSWQYDRRPVPFDRAPTLKDLVAYTTGMA